ncbi:MULTISPECIES: outer membrane lipid asymmetry maintenance protein MlaD [Comamonas]|jgi:phospholipid/cholesterol/gamma-HCH transport system substrate-binding protein|uniref:Outer membrane lipid asymmetry maintenance protein MlaD n=1 Tax=Comamonas squillarum TaxID=2977320 RepID=A0ABY5ZS27_9BURK|nr:MULTISPECIES: outer membrane lipid asymmetry maintenance protein MlaD [Comamonas]PWB17618.1 outer membrane lipid asymmetry maintenance protein MlaD [Comamonas sp. JNW]UXC16474.1 outer membrane lipid asymmetry maintenance protein MlaD [Comamonas sp. PR12]
MQPSKTDIWVGLFVMLGAAALVFLALRAGNLLTLDFNKGYEVTARFDNIGGLKPQAAVRSAGVKVGRVKSIGFNDQTFQADVHIELANGYAFPKDSSFKILTSGLLGDQYVGVEAGFDEKPLASGDTVTNTQSAIVLENLIGQFLYGKASESSAPKAAE